MMKRTYIVLTALLLAGLFIGTASASEIAATKNAADSPQGVNEFYPGDTIYYTMTLTNPAGGEVTINTITRVWDTLPNGSVIELLNVTDGDAPLIQNEGQTATFYANYTVDWNDAIYIPALGDMGVKNTFEAEGYDNQGDDVYILTTRNSKVLEFAELGDFVWYDIDADGIQDAGESGIANVTVYLYDCDVVGPVKATTTTNGSGYYLFDNLKAGNYSVEFVKPAGGYEFSPQDQGADDTKDSDADTGTGETICTYLEPGESDMTWDAGLWIPNPCIDVEKYVWNGTGWEDADSPTGPYLSDSGTVDWKIVVTNCGNVDFDMLTWEDWYNSVALNSSQIAALVSSGTIPTSLAVEATAWFELTTPWASGQQNNTVCVEGYNETYDMSDEDCDPAYYYGADPCIDVEKYVWNGTGWEDADTPTGP